jgi:preprotein translocase subunit SecD
VAVASKPRPGRYLAVVALALIGLYLGLFLGPAQKPALGLDLRGGTQVTLSATPIGAGKVTKSALNQAKDIIQARANGLGVGGAEVTTQGGNNIVVSVPGSGHDQVVDNVSKTALLRFRQVMSQTAPTPAPAVSPSASPSASGAKKATPKKSTSPKPSAKKSTGKKAKKSSSQGRPLSSALVKAHKSPSPTPSPTSTPTAATPTPTPSASATTTSSGGDLPLPGSQSPTLTQAFATSYQNWDCTKQPDPTQGADNPSDYIIACSAPGSQAAAKYLLAPATVEGTDVKTATSALDSSTGTQWDVNLTFTGGGSSKWQKLTAKAYNADPTNANAGTCTPPTGCNAVAIVLDGSVQSAPTITQAGGIPGGLAQITGNFTQASSSTLANVLKYGSLPLRFGVPSVTSVSPTLGSEQLRGGLIAGAIGLGLVVIFSLVYYRALGLVTVGSLAVSGLILYAVTTLLGKSSVGYTLSLPGIAGFIVAVGITADSFVVFFERLRDEVRDGVRLRTAVERAWVRARRTIISADSVSLLAAVILYVVSIGDVRGFAFTLGLSTISDLFIVFFFTKPLLSVLAKVEAFDRGKKWTGIGQAREEGRAALAETARPRRSRSREA